MKKGINDQVNFIVSSKKTDKTLCFLPVLQILYNKRLVFTKDVDKDNHSRVTQAKDY